MTASLAAHKEKAALIDEAAILKIKLLTIYLDQAAINCLPSVFFDLLARKFFRSFSKSDFKVKSIDFRAMVV